MRARIQGTVWVECVVQTERDSARTRTSCARSIRRSVSIRKPSKAARQFRFRPGMRLGEPVAVLVTIELSFTLH